MDSSAHRLYITRGTHVMVLDVESGKLVGDIPKTNGVHGVAVVPKLGRGYISDGRDNDVMVFDTKTFKEITHVKVGTNPDIIMFDTASNKVYCFNGRSNDVTVIDPATNTVVGTVQFTGKPEFAESDGKNTIYVNIEDKSQIERFDTKTLKVLGAWPLAPGEEPTGLGYDSKNHLLFSACANGVMAVTDAKTGKVIATPKIGNGPDGAAYDSAQGIAFSPNGADGTLTVIQRQKDGTFTVLETVPTMKSARTMAFDPKTHKVYLIAAQFEAPTGENRRGKMVPGTAVILVLGPTK